MSATRARQRRAARLAPELVMQAHDRLHRDDVDGAHSLLHQALGVEEPVLPDEPLVSGIEFDAAFRRLCIASGMRASYVAIDPVSPVSEAGVRLCSGGDGDLCRLIDGAVRSTL